MESKLEVFNNEEFGSVRVIRDGDKYLFCGSDVAKALGYNEPHKAVARHCKGGMKRPILTNGGNQDMIVIPEGDVYRLIVHSKLPSAERFEKWVFDEVLPCIRKHRAYMDDSVLAQVMENPDLIFRMAEAMLHERTEKGRLGAELAAAKPKADYFDAFICPEDCTNIRATAKELQVSERWFVRFLVKAGFMYRCPAGTLMPYNNPKNEGLFRVKDFIRNGHKGAYTLITPKGKDLLRQLIPEAQATEV
ncbi:MAG: BRO family protein [Oscillospiraceae bacterium]|nr:BRO family protein [Oscillospiraceae bacterium]